VSSAFFLAVTLWDESFTVLEACLCIAGFALYLLYAINVKRKHEDSETEEGNAAGAEKRKLSHKIWLILVASVFFIYLGATYTVDSVI